VVGARFNTRLETLGQAMMLPLPYLGFGSLRTLRIVNK
jgi:hypothetical protein